MAFSTGLLWLNVVLFGVYGLAYLLAPDACAQLLTGAPFPTPAAAIDARAIYGGLTLGFTALLWLLARGGLEFQRVGQLGCASAYGFVALGRLAGLVATGSHSAFTWSLLGAETVFAGLSYYAFSRLRAG